LTDDLDLPDEGCWAAGGREVEVGDICRSALLPNVEAEEGLYLPGSDEVYWVQAQRGYALVIRVIHEYAVVAPIAVAEAQDDLDEFRLLVESGRTDATLVRLPALGGAWDEPAVALLFKPGTQLTSRLRYARVASTTPDARQRLMGRIAAAFEA
jgi:hypothetical protein